MLKIEDKKLTSLQQEIVLLLEKDYKTKELEQKLSIKRRELIKEYYNLLINSQKFMCDEVYNNMLIEYKDNCCFKEFSQEQIAIISDTHFASKYENLEYLEQFKAFIKEKNIKYLLHGGDIGDGMVAYSKKYSTYPKQLEHILEVYDLGPDIKQYLLGGNHDIKYKRKSQDYDILNLLEENNPNIEGVGYYQAYFKIESNVISFQHQSFYNKSFIGRDLNILGHAHYLSYKPSTVILPTLSDSFPNSHNSKNPGFLVLDNKRRNNHTFLEFKSYITTNNGIEQGKNKTYTLR